ncbi:MAG TPA: hypothetical protein VND64_04420 [Pirellulales bacterium]|nr:hypothetical protein [Pirellulales bacterium]
MSTVTELGRFRSQNRAVLSTKKGQPLPAAPGSDLRALWNDMLATLAMVALASIVVFEVLRNRPW